MKTKQLILSILLLNCCFSLFAQKDLYITITGKTIDMNKQVIPMVNILISGSPVGTVSNINGIFRISVKLNDTLVFSSLAYKKIKMPVSGLKNDTNFITLHEELYELNQVNIFDARWQDFKFEMMNAELDPMERNILIIEGLPDPYMKLVPVSLVGSPVSFLYEYFKKENVIKRKREKWNRIYENNFIRIEKKP